MRPRVDSVAPRRRWAGPTLLALLILAAGAGCRDRSNPGAGPGATALPSVDLTGVEEAVAQKIHAAHAAVIDNDQSAEAWGRCGIVLEAHGFDDAAAACYEQAARLSPDEVRWPYLAGHLLANLDPAAAVAHFERALALDSNSALIRHVYGDLLLNLGQVEAAQAQYEQSLAADPAARRALLGLGEIAMRRDDLDRARALLEQAADLEFFDREVHAKLARLHRRRGDHDAAETEALLVRAYPDLAPVHDPYRAPIAEEAVSVKALTQRGLASVSAGRLAEAEQQFWDALKARPDSVRNRVNLAGVLVRQQRLDEAMDLLRRALDMAPDDPDVLNTMAVALLASGQADAAAEHLRRAMAIDPAHDEALLNLGRVLEQQGQAALAEDAYRQALVVNPVNVPAHERLAKLLDARQRGGEALEHWRRAALFGRFGRGPTLRFAVAASQQGQFGQALSALRRALQRAPDDVPLMAVLVTIQATCPYSEFRDGDDALRWAERLMARTGGRHVPSLNLLAAAQAERGDFAGAIATSERARIIAQAEGNASVVALIDSRLRLYRAGQPYHQAMGPGAGPAPP